MTRLEVPLKGRALRATGDILLRAELVLSLKTIHGNWQDSPFLVDSGTEMTTMPAYRARVLDLPLPGRPARGLSKC